MTNHALQGVKDIVNHTISSSQNNVSIYFFFHRSKTFDSISSLRTALRHIALMIKVRFKCLTSGE